MIIRIRLPSCPLFEGIAPEALLEELARLQAAERKYKAGETLLAAGSPTSRMGLVLEGELHAILPLPQGRQLLQSRLLRGELFGQLLALDGERESPVTVTAHTPCRVLWIPMKNLLTGGGTPSSARLLSNLCRQLSSAYFSLQRRLICLTQPTTCGRNAIPRGVAPFVCPLTGLVWRTILGPTAAPFPGFFPV